MVLHLVELKAGLRLMKCMLWSGNVLVYVVMWCEDHPLYCTVQINNRAIKKSGERKEKLFLFKLRISMLGSAITVVYCCYNSNNIAIRLMQLKYTHYSAITSTFSSFFLFFCSCVLTFGVKFDKSHLQVL